MGPGQRASECLPIIEADIYGDHVVIASEYAPDGSLDTYLKNNGKAHSVEAAVEIVSGILAGLEHLHSRSIIHRDLKPANILFQGTTPRLADFGISRVLKSTSQSSNIMGTPSYMAHEAFDGKRNEQTDIWSVGVIFYQLLSGRLPFEQADITSLLGAILTRNPEPLPTTVPKPLQNVIARALTKDPNLRYKSAAEMRKLCEIPTKPIRILMWINLFSRFNRRKTPLHRDLFIRRNPRRKVIRRILFFAAAGHQEQVDLDSLARDYPKDTLITQLWLPTIYGLRSLQAGKAKEAIEELRPAERYERAGKFYPQYTRCLANLRLGQTEDAAREFDKILDHRGEAPLSSIYPLAQLGKARATRDRAEYEKFFELWKDADKDMPALVAARSEFDALG